MYELGRWYGTAMWEAIIDLMMADSMITQLETLSPYRKTPIKRKNTKRALEKWRANKAAARQRVLDLLNADESERLKIVY